jgi:glycosyltransferase involved in cell wall biosynthesis
MPVPLLLDLSHTSHTRARTGIQRVTRALRGALAARAIPVTHDPHRRVWRELEQWELDNLSADGGASKRGAQWPLGNRLRGRMQRALGRAATALPDNSGVVVPEVFSPAVAAALPALFAAARGPRVALFHDAIALKFPELTPPKTVARFPPYLIELLAFDGIAAVSEDSRDALVDYWRWLDVKNPPPVRALPLGIDVRHFDAWRENQKSAATPIVLSVGSIEGRKNHATLLEACEQLWQQGAKFSLHLIGLAHPQTGAAALVRIQELKTAGRPLRYDGPAGDADVDAAYASCTFTVYPSICEGFGLPVIESLAHGKPCICSGRGALGESARGGGCIALEQVDATALRGAIGRLLDNDSETLALGKEASARRFKTWNNYADELLGWMDELKRPRTSR